MWFKKEKKREMLPPLEEINRKDDTRYVQNVTRDEEDKGKMHHIVGSPFPFRGVPDSIKLKMTELGKSVFDKSIIRIAKMLPEIEPDELSKSTRELARVFDLLIEAEKLTGQKVRWRAYKKVICFFWENDVAYRLRGQWFFGKIDQKKIMLDEADKYYFRPKNFRVDLEEEWIETLKKYPQLKDDEKFKDFLFENIDTDETKRTSTILEEAEKYLKVKKQ